MALIILSEIFLLTDWFGHYWVLYAARPYRADCPWACLRHSQNKIATWYITQKSWNSVLNKLHFTLPLSYQQSNIYLYVDIHVNVKRLSGLERSAQCVRSMRFPFHHSVISAGPWTHRRSRWRVPYYFPRKLAHKPLHARYMKTCLR